MEVSYPAPSDHLLERDGPHVRPPSVTLPETRHSPKHITELQNAMHAGYGAGGHLYDHYHAPPPKYGQDLHHPHPPFGINLVQTMSIAENFNPSNPAQPPNNLNDNYIPYSQGLMQHGAPPPPPLTAQDASYQYHTTPPPYQPPPLPPLVKRENNPSSPFPQQQQQPSPVPTSQENGKVEVKSEAPASTPHPTPLPQHTSPYGPLMSGGSALRGYLGADAGYKPWGPDSRQPPGKLTV